MKPLRDTGSDVIWVEFSRKEGAVDLVEIIGYVPASMSANDLEPMAGAARYAPIPPFELEPHRPPNHHAYGFRGLGVTSNRWGMHLNKKK
ncbi:MAG: hypothetical protein M3Y07_03450 [Acidobacteriota bacterium]|nr:hypothetical protein [Acidobacteriota bacterium]